MLSSIQAKDIFTSICPNEDFLLAVPNPEDIIWDDIGSNTKEEPGEQAGDDVVPTTDKQYPEGHSTKDSDVAKTCEEPDTSDMKATEISTCDESPNVEDGNEDTSNEIEA